MRRLISRMEDWPASRTASCSNRGSSSSPPPPNSVLSSRSQREKRWRLITRYRQQDLGSRRHREVEQFFEEQHEWLTREVSTPSLTSASHTVVTPPLAGENPYIATSVAMLFPFTASAIVRPLVPLRSRALSMTVLPDMFP